MRKNAVVPVEKIFAEYEKAPKFKTDVQAKYNKLIALVAVHQKRDKLAGVLRLAIARIEKGSNTSMDTISKIGSTFDKQE